MSHIIKHKPFRLVAAGLVLALSALVAHAQDTSGKPALLEAVEAARNLKAMTADVVLSGAGGGMFQAFIPTGSGTLKLARQDEPVQGRAWNTRLDTTYIHKKGDEQQQNTALRTPTIFSWIDHEKKVVQEHSFNEHRSQASTVIDLMGLPELTAEEPFGRELREGTSWIKHDQEKVNGVLCDVVEIHYDMTNSQEKRRGGSTMIRTPASKWYLGVDDHLPRRVERITDEGMLAFTIVLDVKNLAVDPDLKPKSLAIETPEGYTRAKRAKQIDAEVLHNPNRILEQKAPEPVEIHHPDKLPAHGFELVDGEGNPVSLDSLKGNVAVLYFWGTWCVPCKTFSPLVSNLVDTFQGEPVKVFGLPVRERSEETVREVMSHYKHTLLLNPGGEPIGCDRTARAYKVRRYPTIYVIGFDSEVLAVKWPEKGVVPADMMGEITETIRDYLDSKN